ncbi:MAG: hypothetical protein ACREOF_03965 [Gemmatimonadales bacterium]
MDGDFPWVLGAALLLWLFNLIGGRKRTKVERPQQPRLPRTPRAAPPRAETGSRRADPTQTEGGQLEELLRALERRLDPPTPPPPPKPAPGRTHRGPLGRPASVPLPAAEELEERESLESEPVVESLDIEVRRPARVTRDWQAQAEAREQTRQAQVEARDDERHKSRHASFDKRIRAPVAAPEPAARRLTTAQIRQAFIWSEILGKPKGLGGDR